MTVGGDVEVVQGSGWAQSLPGRGRPPAAGVAPLLLSILLPTVVHPATATSGIR